MIHKFSIVHGVGPVTVAVIENAIYTSYWNGVSQRSELSVVSLYEVSNHTFTLHFT